MIAADDGHGTPGCYRAGCKCAACRAAIARSQNVYLMRRAANGGQHLSVPKIGAVRRIQALMALGWPRRELARRAGYEGDAFALILNGRRTRLFVTTHERVVDLYDRLSMTPGPSDVTRSRAAAKGWAPPLAWDDDTIDDPAASPHCGAQSGRGDVDEVAVLRRLAGDRIDVTVAERRTAVAQLWHQGLTAAVIARRCGFNEDTVEKDIERLGLRRNAVAS